MIRVNLRFLTSFPENEKRGGFLPESPFPGEIALSGES